MFGNIHDECFLKPIMSGTFEKTTPEEVDPEEWKVARGWHAALVAHNVLLPGSMRGNTIIQKLDSLEGILCPVRLYYPFLLQRYTPEQQVEMRAAAEKRLVTFLEEQGY
jgi:hypothetical protein